MATTDNAVQAYNGTTDGAAADTITMKNAGQTITVLNLATTGLLYFRIGGTAAVVGAKENFPVPPGGQLTILNKTNAAPGGTIVVSVISGAAAAYAIVVIS